MAATQCEVCGRLGQLEIFHMSGSGDGVRVAVPCADRSCPGRMWTVGRYGVPRVEGALQTVLITASPAELQLLGDLAARGRRGDLDIESVVDELQRAGTPTTTALAEWVRANQANFTAASTLLALLALLCQIFVSSGGDTTNVDIDVTRIVVRDDGEVVLRQGE